ncbi:unnamed protein product, partial [Mesorhabditis spiculigera]
MGKQQPKRNSDTESSVSTSAESNKVNEGLANRFVATLLVLVSAGLCCIISHRPLTSSSTTVVYMGGLINFGLLLTFARWTQLHSQKLTRHVRPMLDIAQILRTNAVFRPDGSAWLMPEKYVAYNLCCADPCIDEEAPRTEERDESPPASPTTTQRDPITRK